VRVSAYDLWAAVNEKQVKLKACTEISQWQLLTGYGTLESDGMSWRQDTNFVKYFLSLCIKSSNQAQCIMQIIILHLINANWKLNCTCFYQIFNISPYGISAHSPSWRGIHILYNECTTLLPYRYLTFTTIDALDQWCLHMLLGIKWYQCVWNDDVWRLTKQPKLTAIIQSCRLTLFGRIMCMDDNADANRILLASPQADWRR